MLMTTFTPGIAVLDKDRRIFSGWGTVEVTDRENDIVTVDDVRSIISKMEERGPGGALIGVGHSNQMAGKTIAHKITKYKLDDGKEVPAIWVVGQIHKHYPSDDDVWSGIMDGTYSGFSLGGRGKRYKSSTCSTDSCPSILKTTEGWEWTLAKKPMNQLSELVLKQQFNNFTVTDFTADEATDIAKSVISSIEKEEAIMEDEEMKKLVEEFKKSIEEVKEAVKKDMAEFKTELDEVKKAQTKPEPEPAPAEPVEKGCGGTPQGSQNGPQDGSGPGAKKEDDKDKKSIKKEDLDDLKDSIIKEMGDKMQELFEAKVEKKLDEEVAVVETPAPGVGDASISKEALEGQDENKTKLPAAPWEAPKEY